jgi:hypothetical protein
MPLIKGKKACKKKNISKNIRAEVVSGKPQKQAIAIGFSICRQAKKKKGKRK